MHDIAVNNIILYILYTAVYTARRRCIHDRIINIRISTHDAYNIYIYMRIC